MDIWHDVKPGWGPFAPLLTDRVGMYLSIIWAAGFVYAGYNLVKAITRLARARRGHEADMVEHAERALLPPVLGTIGLAAVPVIWALIAFA